MKLITGFFCIATVFLFSCSNNLSGTEVPAVLTTTLMATFPEATDVEWEKKLEDYEAEFDINKVEYTALMNASGEMIMYKHDVTEQEFPEVVRAVIHQKYNGMKLDDYEKLFLNGQSYFQVELDGTGKVFSSDGQEQTQVTYWE